MDDHYRNPIQEDEKDLMEQSCMDLQIQEILLRNMMLIIWEYERWNRSRAYMKFEPGKYWHDIIDVWAWSDSRF